MSSGNEKVLYTAQIFRTGASQSDPVQYLNHDTMIYIDIKKECLWYSGYFRREMI